MNTHSPASVPQVVPRFLPLIRDSQDQASRGVCRQQIVLCLKLQFFIEQFGAMALVIKYHIRKYLPEMFVIIRVCSPIVRARQLGSNIAAHLA